MYNGTRVSLLVKPNSRCKKARTRTGTVTAMCGASTVLVAWDDDGSKGACSIARLVVLVTTYDDGDEDGESDAFYARMADAQYRNAQ